MKAVLLERGMAFIVLFRLYLNSSLEIEAGAEDQLEVFGFHACNIAVVLDAYKIRLCKE